MRKVVNADGGGRDVMAGASRAVPSDDGAGVKLKVEYVPVGDLVAYGNNAKMHPDWQLGQIADSIGEFDFNAPVQAWHDADGRAVIVAGHGRVMAAKSIGLDEVPVIFLDHLSDEQRRAYGVIENQLTMNTGFDMEMLKRELDEVDFRWDDFGFFDNDKFQKMYDRDDSKVVKLSDDFVVPPFSVLDTKAKDWRNRRAEWLEITGDLSETRSGDRGDIGNAGFIGGKTNSLMRNINGGTSNFDPVLAECMYRWFCPVGGRVLDPFGGEQTKGVVAGELGYRYLGVELRPEQVNLNREKVARYTGVDYICGNSCDIRELVPDDEMFDMCFTSPPYYDLEIYSDDDDDMSAVQSYGEFMDMYKTIFEQCYSKMNDDSFCVVKVGEVRQRDGGGGYYGFVPDNIRVMTEIGFVYYNEIILANSVGTLPIRVRGSMATRKIGKMHQNVLVFYKGDPSGLGKRSDRFPLIGDRYFDRIEASDVEA